MTHAVLAFGFFLMFESVVADSPPEQMRLVVRLSSPPDAAGDAPRTFNEVPGRSMVVRDLDLEESVEGADVYLAGSPGDNSPCRFEVQYETSVTITNEGPHLDLRDWKHYTSEWRALDRASEDRYQVPIFGADERSLFPSVKPAELREAVRAAGGHEWADIRPAG